MFINRFRYQATKAKQVQSRIKELEKIERIEIRQKKKTIHFQFPQPKPSGRIVAEFKESRRATETKDVFRDANFLIERGDRIALVGVNGAGKSTLIKLLAGAEPLTAGEYKLGHNAHPTTLRRTNTKSSMPTPACSTISASWRRAPRNTELRTFWDAFCFPRTMSSNASACSPAGSATAMLWRAC